MTNTIYITTAESRCGKSLISLGVTEMLLRKTQRVGVFRPIISQNNAQGRDKNIDLILNHFKLDIDYEDTYAFRRQVANELIGQGQYDEVLNGIIGKYKALEEKCDFILCIGSDVSAEGSALEFELNADIAQNLGSPVLILGRAMADLESTISPIKMAVEAFVAKDCQVVGAIVNRAQSEQVDKLRDLLHERLAERQLFISVIPADRHLDSPTLREVSEHLQAEAIYAADQLERQAYEYLVVASQIQSYLPRLTPNMLVVTPGDRPDVLLSALLAHQSSSYPRLAGILLTGGHRLPETVKHLLNGLPSVVPIIVCEGDTYQTATRIGSVRSYLTADNQARIALSLKIFEEYVNTEVLEQHISTIETKGITPRMFQYNLIQQARSKKQHVVLPEGTDPRILKATEILLAQELVNITLLGKENEVRQAIRQHGSRIPRGAVAIVEPQQSPKFFEYVETLYDIRHHKGITLEYARDLMSDVSYFGTMMVYKGDADGMVSGAVNTTQHTIRPALQFVRTKPGVSVVSSIFFMCLDDQVLVYGDCAVNPNPTAEELSEIAISSAETSEAFGLEPRVAMLSYSSGASGKGEEVEKVRTATELVRKKRPHLKIEGPIQYDAAVDMTVAKQKLPDSEVAGRATVLIFPDLNTGNNTYKAVQRETGAIAMGPVLQGLNKPVNDLSRGCTVEDIVNTVIITAIQSQAEM